MPTQALRLQIVKPYNDEKDLNKVDITWKDLGKILSDLSYASAKMANYGMRQLYFWEEFKREYKLETGVYPDKNEHKDKHYLYPKLRKMFNYVPGNMVNQVERFINERWKTDKLEVLSLKQQLPSFKLNFPILIHNDSYQVKRPTDSKDIKNYRYLISTQLFSVESQKQTRYEFVVDSGDYSKKTIVERILSGEYKGGRMQIINSKNKWYCIIAYTFPSNIDNIFEENKIMGIDMGIKKAIYYAFNDSLKRGSIDGNEIYAFQQKIRARRISILRQGKYCGDGRNGHGLQRKMLPTEILKEKESNFRNTVNHKYAKHIVNIAIKERCGVIHMEDLSGVNNNSKFLKNWPYFDLQSKIIAKATAVGIKVFKIKAAYTSQTCNCCGHVDAKNRPDQATFKCQSCGHGSNADYNAARNISMSTEVVKACN